MDTDVIVVGAGPAGLMLAAELRLAGTAVTVLERLEEPGHESRGMGFTARTLEVFDQRGLLARFGELNRPRGGHFGSVPIDFSVGDGVHASVSGVPQGRTVAVLEQRAVELGADLRRGHALVDVVDAGDHVEVRVDGPDGELVLTAAYLVGCDGGRSAVRRICGFDFPGTDATTELLLADVVGLDRLELRGALRTPRGMLLAAPMCNGLRLVVHEQGAAPRRRTGPPTYREFADTWRRVSGQDIDDGAPVWVSHFSDAARQAAQYRIGRVFLAGDSAHIHLPASGQGMNVSIQDAFNLGWKLAAVVDGRAGDALLDTYHTERHPVGAQLLQNTRAQASLFLGGDEMGPLRSVLAEVFRGDVAATYLAGLVSGLDIRYDVGPGTHPLRGLRMPVVDLLLGDGTATTSTELQHDGRALLLLLDGTPVPDVPLERWAHSLDVVSVGALAGAPAGAVLLRPDGYVAWAQDGDLTEALSRMLGDSTRDRVNA